MAAGYKWHPITDLGDDPRSLTDGELESLWRVWQSQKKDLAEREVLNEFEQRLRREWAIETGIIEDVYTLDRGVTRTLIEKGIDAALIPHGTTNKDPVLVARVIQDHFETLEGMFDFVGGQRSFSTGYVKELHAALLRNQDVHAVVDQFGKVFEKPLEKGAYKSMPNNPTRPDGAVHEYCPPEHVGSEMDELVRMYSEHQTREIPPEVEAAWLHHRFTQIHPFADGNGRVARALASLVFVKRGWFPLIVKRDDPQRRYIEALEKADAGDVRPLVAIFVESQRTALIDASEIAYDVTPITSTHDAVIAVRDRLLQRGRLLLPREWARAKETATELVSWTAERLGKVAQEVRLEIGDLGEGFSFGVRTKRAPPDLSVYYNAVILSLNTGRKEALTISFQAIGPHFRGLIEVIGQLDFQGSEPLPIEGAGFQINYEEDLERAKSRFSTWLDGVIVRGLNQWRQSL
jgi:fido (protein-threonine AMPylation protein)